MKRPEHNPLARVPEIHTSLTIESLPIDVPYYVSPSDSEDDENSVNDCSPVLFIAPGDERSLHMVKDHLIDAEDTEPVYALNKVGIMKTMWVNATTHQPEFVYIADLRLLAEHKILDLNFAGSPVDQEDFMNMAGMIEDSVKFAGFLSIEEDFDAEDGLDAGTFFGDESLIADAMRLGRRTNAIFREFMESVQRAENHDEDLSDTAEALAGSQSQERTGKMARLARFITRGDQTEKVKQATEQ